MITPESIERVREAADIVEIVGEHVKLRRSGNSYRGPCPFHNGKGPNFAVTPKTNLYYCFVCHAKGDVIGFVRDHLGLDFADAVRYVADRAGVEVQEVHSAREAEARDAREPLWECNAAAAALFQELLWDEALPEARAARDYLAGRDLSRADAERFQLGYAPGRADAWRARLAAQGHDEARQLEVGLLARKEEDGGVYAAFRERLMIPIHDGSGRVVGFGGRLMRDDPQLAKYRNTAQGPLFDKGRLLFGLSWAKHPIRKAERALVVEGYFDAMRLALAGVEEAVAPNGTALTEHQAAALAKLTREVFLLYDSDRAGLKATFAAGRELLRHGVAPRVVTLPGGEDPDSYVRAHGPGALAARLAEAVDVFERQVQLLERRGWFAELHKTRGAVDKLLPTVRAAADPVTRDLYLARLAEVSRIDREVLAREAAAEPRRPGARARPAPPEDPRLAGGPPGDGPPPPPDGDPGPFVPRGVGPGRYRMPWPTRPPEVSADNVTWTHAPSDRPFERDQFRLRFGDRRGGRGRRAEEWITVRATPRVALDSSVRAAERQLIRAMVQDRSLVDAVAERWPPSDFHGDAYRELFARLVDDPQRPLDEAIREFPESAVRAIQAALEEPDPTPDVTVSGWLLKLQAWALDEEKALLVRRLAATDPPPREDEKDVLLRRLDALQRERAALSPAYARVGTRGQADRGPAAAAPDDGAA